MRLSHDSVPWWLVRRSRAALVSAAHSFSDRSVPRAREFHWNSAALDSSTLVAVTVLTVPRVQREEDQVRLAFGPAPTQMALCLRPCLLRLLRRELLRAFAALDDSTPQRRISELRVWSYEPFIVFAPSSSGYTSGQNCLACKVFTTVCSSSDLVGSISSLCV